MIFTLRLSFEEYTKTRYEFGLFIYEKNRIAPEILKYYKLGVQFHSSFINIFDST